jgi:hypothetical protein
MALLRPQILCLPGYLLYNSPVRVPSPVIPHLLLTVAIAAALSAAARQAPQQPAAPAATGARILLLPRQLVSGERSTLAVLDVNGRLTPGVNVTFSNGDKVTTDTTGRARFVAPLNKGTLYGSIENRSGRVSTLVLSREEVPDLTLAVTLAPRVASLSDRFEIEGHGFCGDADANKVTVGGAPALVLASSPGYLSVLPPVDLNGGPAQITVSCGQRTTPPFSILFVSLELEASNAPLKPNEHRSVLVHVKGTASKVRLEARNLAPDVADLQGGNTVRVESSGGADNVAKFELIGKKHGNFIISIRLLAPLSAPKSS